APSPARHPCPGSPGSSPLHAQGNPRPAWLSRSLTEGRRYCKPYRQGLPMLEPWIIEQIRRREEEERRRHERPQLELPLPEPIWPPTRTHSDNPSHHDEEEDEPKRGVIIIGI